MLDKSQRLIFKYPDGTYCYAYKCNKSSKEEDGKDTWLQVKNFNGQTQPEQIEQYLSEFQVI